MSQQQKGTSFIKDLVSRREDKTRIVSCLPLDKPGSSGSKLTDSPFGVRFGYNQNTTSSTTQQQKLNSSRSVLGTFVEPRGVLAPPTLLLIEDDGVGEVDEAPRTVLRVFCCWDWLWLIGGR